MSKSQKAPEVSAKEMMEAAVTLHAATTGLLVALAHTLEDAGSMKIADFEANIRMLAERSLGGSEPVKGLMFAFADQLSCEDGASGASPPPIN